MWSANIPVVWKGTITYDDFPALFISRYESDFARPQSWFWIKPIIMPKNIARHTIASPPSNRPSHAPLILEGLTIRRGNKVLLSDMSWQLDAGQAVIIKGANGTGKTSLLRVIAGFIAPHSGRIMLGAHSFTPHQPDSPLKLSYYGLADGLSEYMTARQALVQYQHFRQRPAGQLDSPDSDRFSITPFIDTEIKQLSFGQRQRLALTRLSLDMMAQDGCDLWVLDEPDSGLDTEGRLALEEMISQMLAFGGRVILASHLPSKMRFAHRILDLSPTNDSQRQA